MIFNLECIICIRNYKDMIHIKFNCNINTYFSFDVFYAVINLKIVNLYKPWSYMKILMLFHDFADLDESTQY